MPRQETVAQRIKRWSEANARLEALLIALRQRVAFLSDHEELRGELRRAHCELVFHPDREEDFYRVLVEGDLRDALHRLVSGPFPFSDEGLWQSKPAESEQ